MNLNRYRDRKFKYDGNYITHIGRSKCIRDNNNNLIKIGYKELKHLIYVREFDFTRLSDYESERYGIKKSIYRYVGYTDEDLGNRTAKWSYTNRRRNTDIGKFLKSLIDMYKFVSSKELNNYLIEKTRVLKRYDDKQSAIISEKTLISINKWEEVNSNYIVCLNTNDLEVPISEDGRFLFK